jgi:hypothetical protein
MFIATQVIIAKRCKQPECPLRDGWINDVWHISTMK